MGHFDSAGIPTTGVGFNIRNSNPDVQEEVFRRMGLNLGGDLPADQRTIENEYIRQIQQVISTARPTTGIPRGQPDPAIQDPLDTIMTARAADNRLTAIPNRRSDFTWSGEAEIRTAFDNIIGTYEQNVDRWAPGIPADARERAVLVSLSWNGVLDRSNKLKAAIQKDYGRQEAWYEITYNTNPNHEYGVAKRRLAEGNLFGLYDGTDGNTPADIDDAKEVIAFLNTKKAWIENYLSDVRSQNGGGVFDMNNENPAGY
ncbi:MAG: hypothetical protein M3O22_02730, partial [Pseudomonadota bacterium]|nr:hypothetical protein [Pseudomonadota bacterium]